MTAIRVQIKGLDALSRKLQPTRLVAGPARRFLSRGAVAIQGPARRNAPKDRGRLASSINFEVDPAPFPRYARIGPNIRTGGGGGVDNYAAAQEFGTRPFWPPREQLEAWGRRKGLSPGQVYGVRKAIATRGIKPKRYMRDAVEEARPKIEGYVIVLAREIEEAASRG